MNQRIKNFFSNWPALLALTLGFYYVIVEMLGLDFSYLPGDLGDTRFNLYILEHFYRYFFIGDVPSESYWNAPFMYPQEATISFSDNLLGTAPLYSLFRVLGYSLYSSFQLWFLVITVLNFLTSFLFCKFITKDKYAGALGAFVFTFSIALIAQYCHAQTFARFPIPLAFYFGLKFYNSFKVKDFFLTILMVVYQYYCALYLGFMLMVPVGLMLILAFFYRRRELLEAFSLKWLGLVVSSLIANVLILLPLIYPYLSSPAMIMEDGTKKMNSYEEIFESLPTLKSFLFVHNDTYHWSFLKQLGTDLPSWWDHQLFVGFTVIASMCFLFFFGIKQLLERRKLSWEKSLLCSTAILTFFMFLRLEEFSFYKYLHPLPGFGSMRALQRIINIELLFFGLAVAFMFSIVFKTYKQKLIAFLILLLTLCSDNFIHSSGFYRFKTIDAVERISKMEEKYVEGNHDVISYEPIAPQGQAAFYQIDAMLFAQSKGKKVVNGYTSTILDGYYHFCHKMDKESRRIWFKKKQIDEVPFVIEQSFPKRVEEVVEIIKADENWLKKVKEDVEIKKISLEKSIYLNALWFYNHELEQAKKQKLKIQE